MAGNFGKHLVIITGPTASGKTDLSLAIADQTDAEIISADSRQVFKYMDIGTAKPSKDELSKVKHHFIDYLEPDEYFSAGKFAEEAGEIIEQIYTKGKMPIVAGGSGLYIKALCEGLFKEERNTAERQKIRKQLQDQLERKGKEFLYEKLKLLDPKAADLYPDMNPVRSIRALEHIEVTGEKFSESILKSENKDYICHYFGIDFERKKLYERINKRTEEMWEQGLLEETKELLELGYDDSFHSMNSVGYKEALAFIRGEMDKEEAVEEMKKNTRRFAKRQLTWFRKIDDMIWLDPKDNMADIVMNYLRKRNII